MLEYILTNNIDIYVMALSVVTLMCCIDMIKRTYKGDKK